MGKITVTGIGYKPLDDKARKALASAEVVLASRRLVEVFVGYPEYVGLEEKVKRIDNVAETMRFIRDSFGRGVKEIVVLGSGDPFFFGIGRLVVREFPEHEVEIIPDLSSLQLAFSRIKEPWDDALFVSLHAGPDPDKRRRLRYGLKDIPALLETNDIIGILTDREHNPTAIAALLASSPASRLSLVVWAAERMGYPDERITKGTPDEIAAMSFVHPNVVIVKRISDSSRPDTEINHPSSIINHQSSISDVLFGLREEEIAHSRGLITKDEVRAVTIHALRLPPKGVLWDIGAGSGSLSVEAARLGTGLDVYAIEKDEEQLRLIERNKANFAVENLTVVNGEAPSVLPSLPLPHRVFIGGSGGRLREIVAFANGRLPDGAIIVVNAATLETLNEAIEALENSGFHVRISEVSVARTKPAGEKRYMAALNPVFVITGERT